MRVDIPDHVLPEWGQAAENYVLTLIDRSESCMGKIQSVQSMLSSKLESLLKEKNANLYCFGSPFVSGITEKRSDIDFVFLTQQDLSRPLSVGDLCTPQSRSEQTSILNSISKLLMRDACIFSSIQEKPRARVPYVRGQLKNGFEVDISANRRNGVRNSLLLCKYFSQEMPVGKLTPNQHLLPGFLYTDRSPSSTHRMLSLALKCWGKRTGLIDPVQSFLTSYAFNILICYYMVQRGLMTFVHPDSVSVPHRCPTIPKYRQIFLSQAERHRTLGWYMRDFLTFYNYEFDFSRSVISLSQSGITDKSLLRWGIRDEERMHETDGRTFFYRLCIEDPYEDRLNLGRFVTPLRYSMFRMALHQAQLNGFGYLNLKDHGVKIVDDVNI